MYSCFFPGIVHRPHPIYEHSTCCETGRKATKVGGCWSYSQKMTSLTTGNLELLMLSQKVVRYLVSTLHHQWWQRRPCLSLYCHQQKSGQWCSKWGFCSYIHSLVPRPHPLKRTRIWWLSRVFLEICYQMVQNDISVSMKCPLYTLLLKGFWSH